MSKNFIKTLVLGSIFVSGLYVKPVTAMDDWLGNQSVIEDHIRGGIYSSMRSPSYIPSSDRPKPARQNNFVYNENNKRSSTNNRTQNNKKKETPEQYKARKDKNEKKSSEYKERKEKQERSINRNSVQSTNQNKSINANKKKFRSEQYKIEETRIRLTPHRY